MAHTSALALPAGPARVLPVVGDSMAPTLTFNHYAAVVPVSEYRGAGIYALDRLGQPDFVRCEALGPNTVRLTRDNPRYSAETMTLESFEAVLLGKVAGICSVIDPALLEAS